MYVYNPSNFSVSYANSSGSGTVRAWVCFDGTGTPSVRASGNVSSITDGGTGIFTINFSSALSSNYAMSFSLSNTSATNVQNGSCIATFTAADKGTSSIKVYISDASSQGLADVSYNEFTFVR
jgi:hypothetical protein